MSEFEDFASTDPTADFLAREQEILGADASFFNQEDTVIPPVAFAAATTTPFSPEAALSSPLETSLFMDTAPAQAQFMSPVPDVEPVAITQWKDSFARIISERDAKSAEKKAKIVDKARADLERFYVESKDKAIKKNKADEIKSDADGGVGSIWVNSHQERAYKQIDTQQKDKKKTDSKEKKDPVAKRDTSRFKNLLLNLKNDKNAPGISA